jgi:hypothetical protein
MNPRLGSGSQRASDSLLQVIARRERRGVTSIPLGAVARAAWAYRWSGFYLTAFATALLGLVLSVAVTLDPSMQSVRWILLSASLAAIVSCGALLAGSFLQVRYALRRGLLGTAVVMDIRPAQPAKNIIGRGVEQTCVTGNVTVDHRSFTQAFPLDASFDSPPKPGTRINVLVHPARNEVILELGQVA